MRVCIDADASIFNCDIVTWLFSIHCLIEALLRLRNAETRRQITGHLSASEALSNGAQALISTAAASQHVSAI